jgi:protease-4
MGKGLVAARAGFLSRLTLLVGAALLASGCRGRPRSWDVPMETEQPREGAAVNLEFDLGAGAPETAKGGLLNIPSKYTFDNLVAALHLAERRQQVKGILVAFGTGSIGWARAHELGDALALFRKRGVPVTCHADAWDNSSYAAAARGCDVIAMSPGGEVEATGPAATLPYARELLEDKLKAQVDILQVGKFKGAAEPLTRDGPSEEYRKSIDQALSAVSRSYHKALAERGVEALVGTGPYMGQEAIDKKLVDVLEDRRAARASLKKRGGDAPIDLVFGPGTEGAPKLGLVEIVKLLAQGPHDASSRPHVRLVRLHGEIALGAEGGLLGGSSGIVVRKLVERMRTIAQDDRAKVVVLRIDSPGGSALGSDLAWLAVKELRDKKPVVISVGEMAASGGYYIASAGSRIFAEPESIVGSIGVVGGKIAFGGTLAMVGVHTASFGDPRAARLSSLTEPWDAATRTRLLEAMKAIYSLFLDRIAEGRGRKREDFEGATEGRVFGGDQAKELGLIDEIGGLGEALVYAKKAGGLEEGAPVVVDEAAGFFELLSGDDEALAPLLFGVAGDSAELLALRRWLLGFARATRGGAVAAMLPAPLVVR